MCGWPLWTGVRVWSRGRHQRYRICVRAALLLMSAATLALLAAGCSLAGPEPRPTPDIQKTVEAAVRATLEARVQLLPTETPAASGPEPTQTPVAAGATPAPTPPGAPDDTRTKAIPPTVVARSSGSAVTPGRMSLSATYESIGVEMLFGGDEDGDATAQLEFKRSSDTEWRQGLPLWRTDKELAPGPAFYGSALLLEAGTGYDVRVSVSDPDGVMGQAMITGKVSTHAEDILPAERLRPTHYVSATGDDEASGTSPETAWRTLQQAMEDAPTRAVVQVGPGFYAPPTSERQEPLTLLAQYPAVDDERSEINKGRRSVIEPEVHSSPLRATGEEHTAPWRQVSLKGPATGAMYKVWKWEDSPVGSVTRMGYATTRAEQPMRVAHWDRKEGTEDGYTLSTPEGWAEVLYRNETYNYGFASFDTDVYVRMPKDRDPNQHYVWLQRGSDNRGRLSLSGASIRLSGFEMRMTPVQVNTGSSDGVIDHNLMANAGVSYYGSEGTPSRYPTGHTVQYNLFRDTGTWSVDPSYPAIPWNFVKGNIKIGSSNTSWGRVGAAAETIAVWGRGGARQLVVRHNTIEGYFNGVGGYNKDYDRYSQADTDVHDNVIRQIADDAFEPEQQAINWRMWNNRLQNVSVALSTGPVEYGPLYLFRNEVWKLGREGVGADGSGSKGVGVVGFKYSGSSSPPARLYVVHNTFWTDAADEGADGGAQFAGGGSSPEWFWVRNNIFRTSRYTFVAPGNGSGIKWNEDYNHFATTDTTRGLSYAGTRYTTNVSDYRDASGQGGHTNTTEDFVSVAAVDQALANAVAGDLTLRQGAVFVDAGTRVPNISDQPHQYSGNSPDLGARELR